MTASDPKKVLKQIGKKTSKLKKFEKHNLSRIRKYGTSTKRCQRCGRRGAHISKYGVELCRQCFREIAKDIGFKKYS